MMTEEMAKELWKFVKKNEDSHFVVHCDAGVSRSVAVGTVLRDELGMELSLLSYPWEECRNLHVVKLLEGTFEESFKGTNSD